MNAGSRLLIGGQRGIVIGLGSAMPTTIDIAQLVQGFAKHIKALKSPETKEATDPSELH